MSLINKYLKSHWKTEDFGRGKSKIAKARHRRILKKKSLKEYIRDLKVVYKFPNELTDLNENLIFSQACGIAKHEEVVKVGSRYFIMYYGPEHDSWEEVII